jgi:hypothetical protein
LSGDVFCGLVVGVEVVVGSVIAKESHNCADVFACLISPGQGNIFAGGGCRDDKFFCPSAPVKEAAI